MKPTSFSSSEPAVPFSQLDLKSVGDCFGFRFDWITPAHVLRTNSQSVGHMTRGGGVWVSASSKSVRFVPNESCRVA